MTYAYDWVELPDVETGDTVRVTYVSGQTDTEQTREGEVIEIHANGFTIDHDPDGELATAVREHEETLRDYDFRRDVSTLKQTDLPVVGERDTDYVHATHLNRGHRARDETEVEVA